MQRVATTGPAAPARQGRPPGQGKLAPHREFLIARVTEKPDITMPGLAGELLAACGVSATAPSLSRVLCAAGFSYKKAPLASEQERLDMVEKRHVPIARRQPLMRLGRGRQVFIDEAAVATNMTRLRGRSLLGERLNEKRNPQVRCTYSWLQPQAPSGLIATPS